MRADDSLPTDDQMLKLKSELNFLLWTNDPPPIPEGTKMLVAPERVHEPTKINMQCAAHVAATCALFVRRGFRATTRAGMAFILESSPDRNPDNDYLNEVAKHYWFTLDGHGLVDLSLFAEITNPLIYCNRSVGGCWKVVFGDGTERLSSFLAARDQGCCYITKSKKHVSSADVEQSLSQHFPVPARMVWRYPTARLSSTVRSCLVARLNP